MTLENILLALEHSMNGNFEELDEKVLEDKKTRNVLTTFFVEEQVRPELVAQIRAPSLMYEYLQLKLEEREELEGFRNENPEYMLGESKESKLNSIKSMDVRNTIRKNRYVEQLLDFFDYYLTNKKEFECTPFNAGYIQCNKDLNKKFYRRGKCLQSIAYFHFGNGALQNLIKIASEIRPKIKKFSSYSELCKTECIPKLLEIFEFYKESREHYQTFNANYLIRDKKLKKNMGVVVRKIYDRATLHLKKEGGFSYLLDLVSKIELEIKSYTSLEELIKIDGQEEILGYFKFYLEKIKNKGLEGTNFGVGYLTSKEFQERFGKKGINLYRKAHKFCGGFQRLLELAFEKNHDILKYSDRKEFFKIRATNVLLGIFNYFINNREENRLFSQSYIRRDVQLNEKLNNLGKDLYGSVKFNLGNNGFKELFRLASEKNPEIRAYLNRKSLFETEGPKQLLRIFNFYLENRVNGEKFSINYLLRNEKLKKEFDNLPINVYRRSGLYLKNKGGIHYLANLAAQQRPEILQFWSYDEKRGNRKK